MLHLQMIQEWTPHQHFCSQESMASGSFDYLLIGSSVSVSSWQSVVVVSTESLDDWNISEIPASSSSSTFGCGSSGGSSDISIQSVERFSQTAVNIEPPVTDEVLLVEEGAIGAEEAVLGEAIIAVVSTDVE